MNKDKQADELIVKYLEDTLSEEESREFLELLKSSPEFENSVKEAEKAYALSWAGHFSEKQGSSYKAVHSRIRNRRPSLRFYRAVSFAACALLVAAGFFTLNQAKRAKADAELGKGQITTISAVYGSRINVLLPDGSDVTLNSGSTLSYDGNFAQTNRSVQLSGEALFKVRHDERKVFEVQSQNALVRVYGTTFDVKDYPDEARSSVSLLKGSISLTVGERTVTLHPDEQATIQNGLASFDVSETDAQRSASWTVGKIYFTNETLPSILAYLEKVYDVRFVYDPSIFNEERLSASMRQDLKIEEVLHNLDLDNRYAVKSDGNIITIKLK